MTELLSMLTVVAVVGSGLVAGIFFAFSTFVMRALITNVENAKKIPATKPEPTTATTVNMLSSSVMIAFLISCKPIATVLAADRRLNFLGGDAIRTSSNGRRGLWD